MNIGVLGGTFDPVHRGHVALAEAAMESLGLTRVIFIPAGQPVFKDARPVSPASTRLAMLRLAVEDMPGFSVDTVEIERTGPSYTVDTIASLRQRLGEDSEIYFIVGADSLIQLPQWHRPVRLIELCRLAVAPRPGIAAPNAAVLEAAVPGIMERVVWLDGPHLDISASAIRQRVARGLPLAGLVPEVVARYIGEHGLYRH